MSQYLQNVMKNVFPVSVEKSDVKKALAEWIYNDDKEDLGAPLADCQLCDHKNIRFQFKILNDRTEKELLIGSECIHKFEIPVIDAGGNILTGKEARKKVSKDKRQLVKDAMLNRVMQNLKELGQVSDWFKNEEEGGKRYADFINYYQEHGGFSLRQLLLIMKDFEKHRIKYRQTDYKLKLRRKSEAKLEDEKFLRENSKDDLKLMFPRMTKSQIALWRKLRVEKFNPKTTSGLAFEFKDGKWPRKN